MAKPIVLIIGKPNVGKSTLFNRIIGKRKSIVLDFPGVTRDNIYGEARWDERAFTLIDTCGIFEKPEGIIETSQKFSIIDNLNQASVIVFVIDGRNGISSEDFHIAKLLRKVNSKIILVANKCEAFDKYEEYIEPDVYELGFGQAIPISSEHNKNIYSLKDEIIERIDWNLYDQENENNIYNDKSIIKVALTGRPNAGKSSLFNKIIGLEKAIVSDIPGTTRDVVDHLVEIDGKKILFIDTAGMRKKSTVKYGSIEMYSILRTIKAIEDSDIVISVIDSTIGITSQDQKVAGLAEKRGKGTIIAVNKWDLSKENLDEKKDFMQKVEKDFYFIKYSPTIFTSALKGTGVKELIKNISKVKEALTKEIPTNTLNAALERHTMLSPLPIKKGKKVKIFFATQVGVNPPVFEIFSNFPKEISNSYQQSIRNMIRKNIDPFCGSPLFLKFSEKK